VCGPKLCMRGTSAASLPRATTIRPMWEVLWRASRVYQASPTNASTQA
jgi:hypothetical protein